jgi:hypothetical protein
MKKEKKESGHFNLFPLFEFVAQHPALPPFAEKGEKRKSNSYAKAIVKLLGDAHIPQKGGWYVWGKFNESGFFEPLYVGKASSGKTSNLFIRLRDELREECAAIFATVYGKDAIADAAKRLYKGQAKKTGKDYYGTGDGVRRSLRKTGAHFVMWTVAPGWMTNKDISRVESVIINIFRPSCNMKRPKIDAKALYEDPKVHPFILELEYEIGRILGE